MILRVAKFQSHGEPGGYELPKYSNKLVISPSIVTPTDIPNLCHT